MSSCCDKVEGSSAVESQIHVKIPAKTRNKNIFNIPGSKITHSKNIADDGSLNEKKLREVLKGPLNVIENNELFTSEDVTPNIGVDNKENDPISLTIVNKVFPINYRSTLLGHAQSFMKKEFQCSLF